jgi:hypothetical protein
MRYPVKLPDFKSVTDQIVTEADIAVTAAMDDVTVGLKNELRAQVITAGLGARLAGTWQGRRYPQAKASADASAYVWSKAPKLIDAFDRGATIKSKEGFYLAIPTPAAGTTGITAGGRRQRVTPESWTRRTGVDLRFVYRRGRPSLLVADDARLSKSGLARSATRRDKNSGPYLRLKGRVTVVIFILVPQVTLQKRLDLEPVANKWADRVGDLIALHWK